MEHSALTYAGLGWRVFPCVPGGKRPLTTHGCLDATTDTATIEGWIEKWPDANLAIATDGLLVVDIDPGAEHWPEDEQRARELASTPVIAITPRAGKHYFFRQPDSGDYGNTQNGQLAPNVDTRGTGGFVVVAPSTVNGKAYQWANGEIEIGPHDLPLPPKWILDKLDEAKRSKPAVDAPGDDSIPEGQRNGSLTRLAGAMRRVGATYTEILAALRSANESRCKPPLYDGDVQTIAESVARYAPHECDHAIAQLEAEADGDDQGSPADPGQLPADFLKVPGFIADVIEHNLAGAHKPQPVLALAGALSLLATLTGRKVTDTQGTRTNLYCVSLVGTSTGKQRARDVNKELLFNSGLDKMIGPDSIGSAQGLVEQVFVQPALLFQLDEIGRYLKTMGDAREAYLYNIVSVLMRMFTDSASIYRSDAVVDSKRVKTIFNPHACINGTSTRGAFFDGLTIDSIQDGFLSRVLVFEGDEDVDKRWITKPTIPQSLIDQVRWWGSFSPGGNLASLNPQPIIVESTVGARRQLYELDDVAKQEQRRLGEPLGSLWPRAGEKANKLCLLYACSENAEAPVITDAAATWAVELVTFLTKRLAFLASRWVSENSHERKLKRFSRIIEDSGAGGIAKAGITNATGWLNRRERDEFLETLIEAGNVKLCKIETKGRPRSVYIHKRHWTEETAA